MQASLRGAVLIPLLEGRSRSREIRVSYEQSSVRLVDGVHELIVSGHVPQTLVRFT